MSPPAAAARPLRHRQSGFTVLELMVACSLAVLVAGVAMGLVSHSLGQWRRAGGNLTAEREARQVFVLLVRDLDGAYWRNDGNAWLAFTLQPGTGNSGAWVNGLKPVATSLAATATNLGDARFGEAAVWLRLISSAPATHAAPNEPTVPVAVSYQIIRRPVTPTSPFCQYSLYRAEVTPGQTFLAGYDLTSSAYTTPTDVEGAPGTLRLPPVSQLVANHVIDFGVRAYAYANDVADGTSTLRQIFPVDAADFEYRAGSVTPADGSRRPFPAVVDVMLRVLTDEGARQIAAFEAGQIPGDWWEIANTHSVVFIRRIRLGADPL